MNGEENNPKPKKNQKVWQYLRVCVRKLDLSKNNSWILYDNNVHMSQSLNCKLRLITNAGDQLSYSPALLLCDFSISETKITPLLHLFLIDQGGTTEGGTNT